MSSSESVEGHLASLSLQDKSQLEQLQLKKTETCQSDRLASFHMHSEVSRRSCIAARPKASSTSTIFLTGGSMTVPDDKAFLKELAAFVLERIHPCCSGNASSAEAQVFAENQGSPPSISSFLFTFRKNSASPPSLPPPTLDHVIKFISTIYSEGQLTTECIIVTAIYMSRFLQACKHSLSLCPDNWRPIVLCCMLLASKVWDDLSMVNVDFSIICPSFTLARINQLESAFLNALHFNVSIPSSEYARYYFEMRSRWKQQELPSGSATPKPSSQSKSDPPSMFDAPARPLDVNSARRLEALSTVREFAILQEARQRFVTCDAIDLSYRTRAVLS